MGARLQRFAGVIRQLFPRDSWLQRLAQEGLSLGVRPGRVSAGRPLEPHGSPEVLSAIRQEVVALWRKRAIERVPVNELDKPAVYSRLIVVPKAGGKLRPCLNLRRLNQFVPNETFKMEGMNTVQQLIRPNCWMASLDIRVAYLHVAIHRISVDLLRFVCDGQHWRCRAMIFGASVAPRIFTRLMKALIAPLRDEGIAVGQLHRRLSLTRRVGSGMPPSVLAAESVAGVIRLVDQLREIRTDSNASDQVPGIRDRLSGNDIHTAEREAHQAAAGQRRSPESPVASYEAATGELGRLDRFDTTSSADDAILSRGIVQHLRQAAHNSTPWDTTLELNEAARTDAAWWSRFQDHWNGSCIILCKPTVTIVSDASDFGWGAAIIREDSYRNPKSATTIAETHGSFRPIEIRSWHINEKELRAILLAALCTETPERQRDRDTLGQHDGSSVRDESRRTLATPQSSGTDDMVVSDSESLAPAGLVHSRIEQLDRGLSLETGIRPLRLVDLAPGVPSGIGGVRPLGQGEDRSVRDGTNEQVSQVRVAIPELQCVEDRRILVQMEPGTGLDVGVPTRGHGRQGALEGDRRTSQDDLDLAVQPEGPMVVDSPSQIEAIELEPEDDPGSEPGVQPGGGQPPQPQPVRDEAVEDMGPGARRIGELRPDLPAGVVRTMSRGWARTTARVADRNWDLWISWCRDHQLDLERAPFDLIEANLLGFLDDYASRRNVSSATIAGIRSTFRRIT